MSRVYCPECGASYYDRYQGVESLDGKQCGVRLTGDTWCKGRLTTADDAIRYAIRSLARARDTAHASGYAEAVADVVAWLRAKAAQEKSHDYWHTQGRDALERAVDGIEDSAHVGAAKKGGG